ncbi:somatostatin 1.2 [Cynoglossus semilaevis]|uniref:Somatostatin-2 n=1 Tax=Cynoglossus semilaevis TaxID=244447 RepID=A0A3P8WHF6_CYNSE|nr:somatostatin-2-like [Cynoglossus semilaevis]XP_024911092.1 somatostatin-2-like [Cynoglossus semilaevis]
MGFKTAAPSAGGPKTSPEPGPGAAADLRASDRMQYARCPAVFILSVLVLWGPVLSQPEREQDQFQNQDLDLELRHHRLLQKARSAGLLTQEWSKRAVEDLLAQMSLPEADTQREVEISSTATGERMNMERSIEPSNNLPPRERKVGCKNFYWKGFTSC